MKFHGVKEGCQDVICPGSAYDWAPEEMKKCYYDKADATLSKLNALARKEKKVNVPLIVMLGLLSLFLIGMFVFMFSERKI